MLRSKPVRAMNTAAKSRLRFPLQLLLLLAVLLLWAPGVIKGQSSLSLAPGPMPADVPQAWKPWIGEYGWLSSDEVATPAYVVSEKDGLISVLELHSQSENATYEQIDEFSVDVSPTTRRYLQIRSAGERVFVLGDVVAGKITPDANATKQILIKPVAPIGVLRSHALAASPPTEKGTFRKPELVELTTLDPAIHLDIRYATTNDFLGTPVYTQARAFLQRPAAEALVRALHKLQPLGYGLLIHDAYRPWYVTKIFWDATPPEGKIFVADPSQGSRHNRGCAVDLTLYDLATGKPIEMPGTYDEMSPRSFPDYPGGTSLQRWHRDLLRRAMESEGFTVYEHEWWHFDYKDWHEYPILNIKFEDLHSGQGLASAQ
jgi:D-alanyl-D-alanine dipeptidase